MTQQHVAVLGAGVAGLATAHKLRELGYRVTVVEAKPHAGGLSQTVRDGSVLTEQHGSELVQQTARIPNGHFVNAGPGRLPHHHRRMLGLCAELGVPLEPYIMSSDANLYVDSRRQQRIPRRRIDNDVRGHVSEMAWAQASSQAARDLIASFGALDQGRYRGTDRAPGDPLSFDELSRGSFWDHRFWQPSAHFWQDTLFQPVYGMDQVWRALLATGIEPVYNAPVERVQHTNAGVRITTRWGGMRTSGVFDWCVSSIPLSELVERVQLRGFSGDYLDALSTPSFAPACKVGWYSTTRWWEDHEIYGGISYTDHDIEQFWYPSSGHFGTGGGTLTGAYAAYEPARRLGALDIPDRIDTARDGGALIHDEVADKRLVPTDNAVTVAWHRVPYQRGGWCHWDPDTAGHQDAFSRAIQPEGKFLAIGDQVSTMPGWQEGCLETAERAVEVLTSDKDEIAGQSVPDSAFLTTGHLPTWGDSV